MSASNRPVLLLGFLFSVAAFSRTSSVEAVPCVDYSLAPQQIAHAPFSGTGVNVVIDGNFAYVARLESFPELSGIEVIDISDPLNPTVVESFPIFGGVYDVARSGTRLYVAAGSAGLVILNCSNPLALTQVGALNPPEIPFMINDAVAVAVSGNFALLGEIDSGLRIIDVTNPAAPVLRSTLTLENPVYDVVASGTTAYLASHHLQVIDFSVPTSPVNIGSYPATGDNLALLDDLLAYDELLLDVSNPSAPALLGTLPPQDYIYGVELQDNRALLSLGSEGELEVFDISNPAAPFLLAATLTSNWTSASAVFGTYVLVGQSNGVAVVELGEVMTFPIATLPIPIQSVSLVSQGNYAYVGNLENATQGKLNVVNVSDPAAPVLVNSKILRPAHGLAISGDVIVVAAGDYGAQVVTITNPEVPIVRGTANTPGPARSVAISGTHAFVADGGGGLQIVDISDVAAPAIIGFLDTPGDAMGVALDGNHAFVVDGSTFGGLRVIDVSIPSSPVQIGNLNLGDGAEDVAVSGDVAIVAQTEMIRLIDVSTPSDPHILINFDLDAATHEITIHDNVAYVTGDAGITVVDVSNPLAPVRLGVISVPEPGHAGVANDFLGVALESGGLATFPLQCGVAAVFVPTSPAGGSGLHVDAVRPNPFRSGTSIEFSLPATMDARLSIYDVSGRMVRELLRGPLESGPHSVQWDGLDETGSRTAAGVYMIRLSGAGANDVRRIVQVR